MSDRESILRSWRLRNPYPDAQYLVFRSQAIEYAEAALTFGYEVGKAEADNTLLAQLARTEAALAKATAEAAVLREALDGCLKIVRVSGLSARLFENAEVALSATPFAAATARVVEAALDWHSWSASKERREAKDTTLDAACDDLIIAREATAKGERE